MYAIRSYYDYGTIFGTATVALIGGESLTDALVEKFNVSRAKAEKLKRELGDLRPREARSNLMPHNAKLKTYMADMEPIIAMKPDALRNNFV